MERGAWRGRRIGAFLLAMGVATPALAQQPVLLQVRPHVGDTIRMRLDQQVEMTGTQRVGGADSTMTVTTTVQLRSRCVVEGRDDAGTTVVTTMDSVRITSNGERPAEIERARRAIEGRSVRLRLAPDGSASIADGDDAQSPELRAVVAQMPATLPRRPVVPGETWTRTMELPRAAGRSGGGTLTATFRLDSVTRGGDVAFVSMRGALARDSAAAHGGPADATSVEMSGAVTGAMILDRRRGWMTDARTTLTVRSRVTPPPGARATPMTVRMRMTQWLRTY